ncbi:MAG: hypothetical protein ACREAK_11010 [Nitrosarchaeum sp.]
MNLLLISIMVTSVLGFVVTPTFGSADEVWNISNVTLLHGEEFKIPYRITNGEVESLKFELESSSFILQMNNSDNGHLEISIPRDLTRPLLGNKHTVFALIDAIEVGIKKINENPCFVTYSIPFKKETRQIEIIIGYSVSSIETNGSSLPPIQLYSNSTYHSGDTAIIQGCTSLAEDHENIQINVMDNNKIIQTEYVTPKIDGTFSKDIVIAGEQEKTYSISATYGDYTAVPEFPVTILVLITSIIPIILMRTRLAKIRIN